LNLPEIAMTETLFGGVLIAAALFFFSRRLGLSNFWAGILSGVVPFLLYLAYSQQHWAGGDVLTIHFAVYLASSGLFVVFGGMQKKNQIMHWAPRLIIGFFVGLVVLNAIFLNIAMRGMPDFISNILLPNQHQETIHTAFPGIVPHDLNKLYEPHLKQVEAQRDLGWQVQLEGLDNLSSGQAHTVIVHLLDKQGVAISQANVHMTMWRMANSRDDQQYVFQEVSAGNYQTTMNLPVEGRWLSELHIQQGENSFLKQQSIEVLAGAVASK
jgi:nitrogen fixation protein FixH